MANETTFESLEKKWRDEFSTPSENTCANELAELRKRFEALRDRIVVMKEVEARTCQSVLRIICDEIDALIGAEQPKDK